MSWRYTTSNNKFYFFSEQEIDFTAENLNYEHFLLQEFFLADVETAKKISDYYYDTYGARSLAYLTRNADGWTKGHHHLTDLMRGRITSLMPKFLNKKAKHKLGIHEFMASIKNTVKSFQSSQKTIFRSTPNLKSAEEVISIFQNEYEKIQILVNANFRFNVLTEEEKLEALEISKYILEIKLQKEFDQIERDFNIFLTYMLRFKYGLFSANYSITFFNIKVDITNVGVQDVKIPKFKIKEIEVNSRFKEYSDKYLAYELLSIHKEVNKGVNDSFLNSNDIELFVTHYEELSKGESEVNMNSTFQGEGGILSLNIKMKPLKLLKTSIIISLIKLILYFIIIITLILLAINYKLVILLIFVGIIALNIIGDETKELKSLIRNMKLFK
jgi:hypothetical protein